jgi:hypothetical protein
MIRSASAPRPEAMTLGASSDGSNSSAIACFGLFSFSFRIRIPPNLFT